MWLQMGTSHREDKVEAEDEKGRQARKVESPASPWPWWLSKPGALRVRPIMNAGYLSGCLTPKRGNPQIPQGEVKCPLH
jgi:hypothetical protein